MELTQFATPAVKVAPRSSALRYGDRVVVARASVNPRHIGITGTVMARWTPRIENDTPLAVIRCDGSGHRMTVYADQLDRI